MIVVITNKIIDDNYKGNSDYNNNNTVISK